MARIAYFDCFSGVSGDMVLGALLDLGLPLDGLRAALGSLAIEYGDITADRVTRAGVSATKFRLHERDAAGEGSRHPHHHLKHIVTAIEHSALSAEGKARAVRLFTRLAEAEAAIHNVPLENVHLHEVGAMDSIVDIVGAVHGMEWLAADRIVASPLNVGSGTVECAHGTFPVPAPATLRLLERVPIYAGPIAMEMVTPTGALLMTEYAESFSVLPAVKVASIGYGAGDREFKGHPNVL